MDLIAPNCAKALLWGERANQVHALHAQIYLPLQLQTNGVTNQVQQHSILVG